ncbi:DUF4351 domain-containing protein [Dolichospermum heterosporum]|uniref:DUF4351 domain-containing protein n=1 Tax=Dolichospermum heterosporum TAC447 TaxID=747523 RepID=A0ABY5LV04_9CYAN|nr:DUF4351 domain-containing protein [Dolichospermum heterosporum]UUO15520.1 DUF4351 domain-containing protein [Dolichospermum heterosporum TAC447]
MGTRKESKKIIIQEKSGNVKFAVIRDLQETITAAVTDRPKVKAECLRLLVTLKLNPAKMQLISGFIDSYLRLNQIEEEKFKTELGSLIPEEQEEVMQIVTSWMEQGIERGIEREKNLIIRQVNRKLGKIDAKLEAQIRNLNVEIIELLGESIFDLSTVEDLQNWLNNLQI